MSIAPQLAARRLQLSRGVVVPAAPPGGAGALMPGVPILQQQFPLGAGQLNVQVEIAWGAVISEPMVGWSWTDVTADVQYQQKISITIGRSDESTTPQPAQAALTLDNRSGNYSYGAQSANYPNVHKNVPVRISLWYQGVQYVRFLGYSTGFNPSWDETGNYSIVNLTAAGAKRRLTQAQTPVQSVLTRSIPSLPGLVAYWPMEDGSTSTSFASGMQPAALGAPMNIFGGTPQLASNSTIGSSNPLPVLGTGKMFGAIPNISNTGVIQLRAMMVFPAAADASPDQSVMFSVDTSGSAKYWYVTYNVGGAVSVQAYSNVGVLLYNSGAQAFNLSGQAGLFSFSLTQNGANINGQLEWYEINSSLASVTNLTISNMTVGYPVDVYVAPNGDQTNLVVGQVTVTTTYQDIFNLLNQVNGYVGDYTGGRMDRLSTENGEYLSRVSGTTNQKMGVQTPDTFINLMEGCSTVEIGYLYDGINQGLTFIAQDQITSQSPAMTLDASIGQIEQPLTPVDDDRLTVNEYTATRTNGSSYTYADTYSPLQVDNIGEYPQSTQQDFISDGEQLSDFASFQVNIGTVNDYRWTPVVMWMHHHPELLPTWLVTTPMMRVDVENLSDIRLQLQNLTISLLLEGYTETIDQFLYSVSANCSSYAPWRIAEFAADTGDTNPYLGRADTDGANLTQSYPAGSTSLSVATPSGPLWTTLADDFPLVVNIGGNPITVTNITGSSSPQTFTVTGSTVVAPLVSGAAVNVWEPCLLDVIAF